MGQDFLTAILTAAFLQRMDAVGLAEPISTSFP
jgi:hypothetical protein